MIHAKSISYAFTAILLAGCGTVPQTPEILVKNVKEDGMFSEKDVFEVKRPIAQIEEVFRKKAPECLQQNITSTWRQNGMLRREVRAYTPKVTANKQRVRLTLQTKVIEGSIQLGDLPPDGVYMMVADAYPVGKSATRVESYIQWPDQRAAFAAIKHWATGTNMGCPDMTK